MTVKKLIFSTLIGLLLTAGLTPVPARGAAVITLGPGELEEIFAAIIAKESVWPREELSLSGFSAFPESVQIPAGILDYRLESRPEPSRLGRQSLQVTLLVNGREQERVRLSANLLRLGEVVVTARRINRGEVIGPDDLLVLRREISMLDSNFIADPGLAVGKQSRTTLQAGAIVYGNLLEDPPLVRRGDRVNIVAGNGRILVSAPGEVRDTGARGDLVRVRNLMSRQEIQARVVDSATVETTF
ncbi:MAG TPA: flagellar basal body P-ring formation protein FlgA [Desulfurivibrio alkaliphilus]|uniref:Flagella basal body P-ring formation protein FlgA n=1 Tax=Desulfurivibrio alkaliphilus TaxID=427923 RepID=A0A7C2TKL5_9BACT|nr:flagellar basal body P-ring formation protein FlgA [Desulfurivibrio alkaliphilus]